MSNEELATNILMLNLVEALNADNQDEINRIAKPLAKRICPDTTNERYEEVLYSLGYVEPEVRENSFTKHLALTRSNKN